MSCKGKILVVDDTHETLAMLTNLLNEEGYTTYSADSGELALVVVEKRQPDLILLDVRMPGIDGLEVCRKIKANDNLSHIPIIFLSSANEVDNKVEGLKLGAVDYITKPFQKEELVARVNTHIDFVKLTQKLKEQEIEIAESRAVKKMNKELLIAKQQAEESELKFRLMYENTSVGIVVISLDYKIIASNKAYCSMLGYHEDELVGKTLIDVTHADTIKENLKLQKKLGDGLIPSFQLEKKLIHKNGQIIYSLLNATIIKNKKNEPLYFLHNLQDITERKLAELELIHAKEKIEESETKLKAVFENSQDAIGVSKQGINVFSNLAYVKLFGYNVEEDLIGKSILEQIASSERKKITEYIKKEKKAKIYQIATKQLD